MAAARVGKGVAVARYVSLLPWSLDELGAHRLSSSGLARGRKAGGKNHNSDAPASRATFPLRKQRQKSCPRWRAPPPGAAPGEAGRGGRAEGKRLKGSLGGVGRAQKAQKQPKALVRARSAQNYTIVSNV